MPPSSSLISRTHWHRAFNANGQAPLDSSSPRLGYDVRLISRHLRCDIGAPNVFNRGRAGTYYGGVLTCVRRLVTLWHNVNCSTGTALA